MILILQAAVDDLDRNAEYVRTVMAICARIWDQKHLRQRCAVHVHMFVRLAVVRLSVCLCLCLHSRSQVCEFKLCGAYVSMHVCLSLFLCSHFGSELCERCMCCLPACLPLPVSVFPIEISGTESHACAHISVFASVRLSVFPPACRVRMPVAGASSTCDHLRGFRGVCLCTFGKSFNATCQCLRSVGVILCVSVLRAEECAHQLVDGWAACGCGCAPRILQEKLR